MESKICTKCNDEKSIEEFSFRTDINKYRLQCKTCISENNKENQVKNKQKIAERKKEKYVENKEVVLLKMKTYYTENKETIKTRSKNYYKTNKTICNKKEAERRKLKYKNDRFFALKENIRTNLTKLFKVNNVTKTNRSLAILGCSYEEFKTYVESLWEPWMNWNNYGKYNGELNYGWDIDHIIPVCTAVTEDDIIRLNHYSNLQPLCSQTNRYIKRDSY